MTVPVEFEDGLLQNKAIFDYLEEVEKKVPEIVQDTATKSTLIDLKKELSATITEIDLSEKKQVDEIIQVFRDKNFKVWEVRSALASLVDKITQVNKDFDERRRRESYEAVDLAVKQANVTYQLTGSRWELTAERFTSVDALTIKGELKKSIQDKITNAALQAQANIEQEELLEAARRDKLEKEKQLAEKERELKAREQVLENREVGNTKALAQQLEEERIKAKALENQNANIVTAGESKIEKIIERIENLEMRIEPDKNYSGKSVLNVLNKIKELLNV